MATSNGEHRSISTALTLLMGWIYLIGGAGILVFAPIAGLRTALFALSVGAAHVLPIYYRESRDKRESNADAGSRSMS